MLSKDKMKGILHQINVGSGGVPKNPVKFVKITKERLKGDDWNYKGHGGPEQAVCLFSLENINYLIGKGFKVFPGALGENLTTEVIDYRNIMLGQIYQIGKMVQIQITKPRQPCGTIERAYGGGLGSNMWDEMVKRKDPSSPKWGMSGFYARVLHEGVVRKYNSIELIN